MPAPVETVILLFDGECNLCSRAVDFVMRRDRAGLFRFAARQSAAGRDLLARHGGAPEAGRGVVLLEEGRMFVGADAVLRVMVLLGAPWSGLALVGRAIPGFLRGRAYSLIAANRLRWFGRRECRVPSGEDRGRFLG